MGFLELIHIKKLFGQHSSMAAVQDFNISVAKGEFVSLLGPSGCGKTTTLRMIAGFEMPTEGKILINGADISNKSPNQRNVGMVFQSYALFPNMTVADNIAFGLKIARKPAIEIKQTVKEMLTLIHMEEFGPRYPHQLSGGQQQRVALARALAIYPKVLLLDEPLSALDAKIRAELRNEIRLIQQKLGITTIYVTHDQEEALTMSDRIVVMNGGSIEQIGTPVEIYNTPQTNFVATFVGTFNCMESSIKDAQTGVVEIEGQAFKTCQAIVATPSNVVLTAIRPEMLSLVADENRTNRLIGKVVRAMFLGSVVRLQISIGKTLLSCDTFTNPRLVLPTEGEQISVYFSPESVLILKHVITGINVLASRNIPAKSKAS
jgi:putative spermidine/putrescine transport system ATP-binding protein